MARPDADAVTAEATVEVENLQKRYGDLEAVRGVTFDVAPGETFGFLGPNGAGKSTTISMLCTLHHPDRRVGPGWRAATSSGTRSASGAASASCSRTRPSTST